ncbi:GTPase Era [Gynurincola endophyticus]|uniref:GTPase Era n=1 Tax=Gynurincola endophyticus TaxID=2479004 RepID=UPI001F3393B9|nr:GTPase Era [Gynurincola endophyticus]
MLILPLQTMKAGFVNIFGKPNAGKSTLLNAILGERLAIVSPKVQTTRHRIKGIVTESEYQIIFSDTPGIISPKYKLQEKMMDAVKSALEDADVAILLVDINDDYQAAHELFDALKLRVPALVLLNKIDKAKKSKIDTVQQFFSEKGYCKKVISISALQNIGVEQVIPEVLNYLPESEPFFGEDELTDLPTRFFVAEMVREKIFELYQEEIPYHTTVQIREFKEKSTLTKISADIIVQRETQKMILLGEKGSMIKKLGTESRISIEQFLDRKVFLELFVKVRPKWRDNDLFLKEYGYH